MIIERLKAIACFTEEEWIAEYACLWGLLLKIQVIHAICDSQHDIIMRANQRFLPRFFGTFETGSGPYFVVGSGP